MSEAMELVRQQLGSDAIIVATHEDEGSKGVRITAAAERNDSEYELETENESLDLADVLSNMLDEHGTPIALADHLVNTAVHLGIPDPTLALAGALDELYNFSPLPSVRTPTPVIFIGPPGSGKTVTIAKLAVRSRLAGTDVCLITADTIRAGAVEQISTYAVRLGLEIHTAASPKELATALDRTGGTTQVLVDTTGVNPYSAEDMDRLSSFLEVTSFEPALVMNAGGDPVEAADLCSAFHTTNPTRLIVTGLDMVRRLGSILAAAEASSIPFGDVSIAPDIAASLHTLNPVSLARLLSSEDRRESNIDITEIFRTTGSR